MSYVIGIKQGTISTKAVLMDSKGHVLSYYKTHGSYFPYDGIDQSIRFATRAIAAIVKEADIYLQEVSTFVGGISGVDVEGDDLYYRNALIKGIDSGKHKLGSDFEIHILNDSDIAYYSGSDNPVGALLYIGSGANAVYFDQNGNRFAWGYYIRNMLQGASAIARRAVEAVFDSEIGILPKTKLEPMFLNYLGDNNIEELLLRRMRNPTFDRNIISLVPQVFKIAEEGDEVAIDVLNKFSDELCEVFIAGMKKMKIDDISCDIVLAGGLLQGSDNILTRILTEDIKKSQATSKIIKARYDPVIGSCIYGIVKSQGSLTDEINLNIENTSGFFDLNTA